MGISPESIHKVLLSVFSAMQTSSSLQLSCPKEGVTPVQFVETFTQLRALQQTVNQAILVEEEKEKKSLLAQGGALMADLLDTQLEESESETYVELNFAVLKLKHVRKRKK